MAVRAFNFRYEVHRTPQWWGKFRAMCLERDVTISEVLVYLIDRWIEEEKEKEYNK